MFWLRGSPCHFICGRSSSHEVFWWKHQTLGEKLLKVWDHRVSFRFSLVRSTEKICLETIALGFKWSWYYYLANFDIDIGESYQNPMKLKKESKSWVTYLHTYLLQSCEVTAYYLPSIARDQSLKFIIQN